MHDIQAETLEILRHVVGSRPVALLDVPTHRNYGDSFIYLGEREYLRRLGVTIAYESDIRHHDDRTMDACVPDGAILLHGGGNFGDTWPENQRFREHVVARFPGRRIVQLPQSLHFSSEHSAAVAKRAFAHAPNMVILARDEESVETARQVAPSSEVRFCPDMALGMAVIRPVIPRDGSVLILKRDDIESPGSSEPLSEMKLVASPARDWSARRRNEIEWQVLKRALWLRPAARRPAHGHAVAQRLHARMAQLNLEAAIQQLGGSQFVMTDRLHAAVLASMLGQPVVVVDTPNRKISNAVDAYLHRFPKLLLVSDWAEAASVAEAHFALWGGQ